MIHTVKGFVIVNKAAVSFVINLDPLSIWKASELLITHFSIYTQ